MNKRYYLPLLFFMLALIVDIISTNSSAQQQTLQSLEKKIDVLFSAEASYLFNHQVVDIMSKESLDYVDLNTIKAFENQCNEKGLNIKLYRNQKLILWAGVQDSSQYCQTFSEAQFKAEICADYIDKNLNEINKKTQRSKIFQRASICLYILSILILILLSINLNHALPLLGLVFVRIILLFIPWGDNYLDLVASRPIFTSGNYSSLDLFIDAILIFGAISLFVKKQYLNIANNNTRLILQAGIFVLTLGLVSHIRLIQILVNSDQVLNNFSDISQFDGTDILCLSCLLILLLSIFIFSNSLFVAIKKSNLPKRQVYLVALLAVIASLGISYAIGLDLNIGILAVFMSSWILLFDLFTDVKQKNITWLIWWAIILSVYLSSILFNYDIKKEIRVRSEFLAQAINKTPDQTAINLIRSNDLINLDSVLFKLLDVPTGMKLDKDDFLDYLKAVGDLKLMDIVISDVDGQSLFTDAPLSFNDDHYIRLDSALLFDQIRNSAWFCRTINEEYQYAVLVDLNTEENDGRYPFNYYRDGSLIHAEFKINEATLEAIKSNDKNYLFLDSNVFVKWADAQYLLVSKKSFDSLIKPIALFSMLFVMVILFGLLLSLINIWLDFLPPEWPFKVQRIDSLNSKIQVSLIMVILLSFVVIAFITNSFLNNFLNKEKEKFYRNKIATISNDLRYQTDIANSGEEMIAIAANFADKISTIHNVSIDIHAIESTDSTRPFFNYIYFTKNSNQTAFTEEKDDVAISYVPLKFNNKTVAYASIQYNDSEKNEVKVFDFLGSIFNVYVFLFLIASVLAIFLARSITKPLAILNQKLGKLKLGKQNELIAWDRDDEIGNLISNYNNMVNQLEESAQVLAKTERDSAWREMAKQVAHEIKNPLTPMKLSIQYLEKAIKQNPDEAIVISKKISATLLEQIDNLAEIANAFGNFAELPQSSNIKIEINEVVEMVHNLFRKREDMDITLAVPIDPIMVYGDKNQLIRILNNLVKNAVESVPQNRRGIIKLSLYTQNDNAIIKVSDNGEGIPEDMQDKIFQPKFTTKDSGSGLGLAISANMIESMNGRLYFESKPEKGTDFYIELDIIRPTNYQDQDKRITLD